jgi:hypothetical protein
MSVTSLPWADNMSRDTQRRIRDEDALLSWLRDEIVLATERRRKLINAASQRARQEAIRGRPPRAYRRQA